MKQIETQIFAQIQGAENILIMPSSPPDGDSLGSAMALFLALKQMGKTATVICADPVPEVYQFLPMMSAIKTNLALSPDFIITIDTKEAEIDSLHSKVENDKVNIILTPRSGRFSAKNISFSHGPSKFDLIITVDTATPKQLGAFFRDNRELFFELPVINIDHHPTNERFGHLNYVDITSSSTTQMIFDLLTKMEENLSIELIDSEVATLLLTGIITDTGSFQHSNTTPKSFANAAKLIKKGARQQEIIQHVYKTKHLTTLKLWGRILSNIKIDETSGLMWSTISEDDLRITGSTVEQTGEIIDELLTNAEEAKAVLLLKEKPGQILSGSLRTLSDHVDVSALAAIFGGGGHIKAAGFKIPNATLATHQSEVISKISAQMLAALPASSKAESKNESKNESKADSAAHTKSPKAKKTTNSKNSKNPAEIDSGFKPSIKNISHDQQIESGILYKFE